MVAADLDDELADGNVVVYGRHSCRLEALDKLFVFEHARWVDVARLLDWSHFGCRRGGEVRRRRGGKKAEEKAKDEKPEEEKAEERNPE